jgi:hypothetical protein
MVQLTQKVIETVSPVKKTAEEPQPRSVLTPSAKAGKLQRAEKRRTTNREKREDLSLIGDHQGIY